MWLLLWTFQQLPMLFFTIFMLLQIPGYYLSHTAL